MSRPIAPLFLLAIISLLTILIMSSFFGEFDTEFSVLILSVALGSL